MGDVVGESHAAWPSIAAINGTGSCNDALPDCGVLVTMLAPSTARDWYRHKARQRRGESQGACDVHFAKGSTGRVAQGRTGKEVGPAATHLAAAQ